MKKNLRYLAGAAVGAVVAIGFTSCAYDPYYASPNVGVSYNSGYGDGYGYGNSGFSTSVFIGTGDPSWGYDPTCYSYYDYRSRRYYDPYSYGYYPIGYRPPVVYGVPHPYDWHPGGGYIRPPGHLTNVTLSNYQDRESRYRNSNYGWAKQVKQRPATSGRQQQDRQGQSVNGRRVSEESNSRSSSGYSRESQMRESSRPDVRKQGNGLPSRYNSPVTSSQQPQARQGQRANQPNKNYRPQPQGRPQQSERPQKQKQSGEDKKGDRQYR